MPMTPSSLPPALIFIFVNTMDISLPSSLSSICQSWLDPSPWFPWPHTPPLLPTAVWSFAGSSLSECWHPQHSDAFPLSSYTVARDQVYPLGFEDHLHADDLLVLNSSPNPPRDLQARIYGYLLDISIQQASQTSISYLRLKIYAIQYGSAMELFTLVNTLIKIK